MHAKKQTLRKSGVEHCLHCFCVLLCCFVAGGCCVHNNHAVTPLVTTRSRMAWDLHHGNGTVALYAAVGDRV